MQFAHYAQSIAFVVELLGVGLPFREGGSFGYQRLPSPPSPWLGTISVAVKYAVSYLTAVTKPLVVLERFVTDRTSSIGHSSATSFQDVITSVNSVRRGLL